MFLDQKLKEGTLETRKGFLFFTCMFVCVHVCVHRAHPLTKGNHFLNEMIKNIIDKGYFATLKRW